MRGVSLAYNVTGLLLAAKITSRKPETSVEAAHAANCKNHSGKL